MGRGSLRRAPYRAPLRRICQRGLFALALLVPALSACEKADNEPGPGGVTVGEARALDEAAEMLDSRQLPEAVLQGGASGAPPAAPAQAKKP